MESIFIFTKKISMTSNIKRKICECAINSNFLWIGGNNIGKYQINQYTGANTKNFLECLKKIRFKHSVLMKKKVKPNEEDITICLDNSDNINLNNKNYSKTLNIKIPFLRNLKKEKDFYIVPIKINCIKNNHPYKILNHIFIKKDKSLTFFSNNKKHLKYFIRWLKRYNKLHSNYSE